MKSTQISAGIGLIAFGAYLLARQVGLVSPLPWQTLLNLWPLLLVFFGLLLLFPRGPVAIVPPVLLVIILALVFSGLVNIGEPQRGEYSIPYTETVRQGQLRVRGLPYAELNVYPSFHGDNALTSDFRLVSDWSWTHSERDGTYTFDLSGPSRSQWSPFGMQEQMVSAQLHTKPVWQLSFEMGIATGRIDLRQLNWQQLTVDAGIVSTEILLDHTLPATPQSIRIRTGISNVTLIVPEQLPLRLQVDSPAIFRTVSGGHLQSANGGYESATYTPGQPATEIRIESGIARVTVVAANQRN